jgi:hypothetical protein
MTSFPSYKHEFVPVPNMAANPLFFPSKALADANKSWATKILETLGKLLVKAFLTMLHKNILL